MKLSYKYAAGFFDGEGCVNITLTGGNQMRLRVMIVNTNRRVLRLFRSRFGGVIRSMRAKSHWKRANHYVITGASAIRFLKKIRPYSIVKSQQIDLAFEFWRFMRSPRQMRCEKVVEVRRDGQRRASMVRTQQTLDRELEFKTRMHALNLKGRAGEEIALRQAGVSRPKNK